MRVGRRHKACLWRKGEEDVAALHQTLAARCRVGPQFIVLPVGILYALYGYQRVAAVIQPDCVRSVCMPLSRTGDCEKMLHPAVRPSGRWL